MTRYIARKFVMTGNQDLPSTLFHIIPVSDDFQNEDRTWTHALCFPTDVSAKLFPGTGIWYTRLPEFSECELCQQQFYRVRMGLQPAQFTKFQLNMRFFGGKNMLSQEQIHKHRSLIDQKFDKRMQEQKEKEERQNIPEMPNQQGTQFHTIPVENLNLEPQKVKDEGFKL